MKDVRHQLNALLKLVMQKARHTFVRLSLEMQTSFRLLLNILEKSELKYRKSTSFERHITELGRIREEALAKGAFSAAANAEVARGKAAGLYIEQKISLTGKIEDLSIEELESKMKRIYEENRVLVEGEYSEVKNG